MRTHRGHRHTQSLNTPPPPSSHNQTGLLTPPTSRSKTFPPTSYNHNTQPPIAPPSFLTTPTRSKPTLAMSVLIHSPAPLPHHQRSPRPISPALPRRNSLQQQQQQQQERPPSRSERLLRDTLIRDELERNAVPPLPLSLSRSLSRRPTNSRRPSHCEENGCCSDNDDDDGEDDDDDGGPFLFRAPMTAGVERSSRNRSTGHGHARRQSLPHPHPHPQQTQGRCTSPTPSRRNLQRSANSLPTPIPRSHSHTNTTTNSNSKSRSRSHSHSHSLSSIPVSACALTPHEAVLRSRLEKVLSMGREEVEAEERREAEEGKGREKRRSRDGKEHHQPEWLWASSQDVSKRSIF